MNDDWDAEIDDEPLVSCVMPTYGRPEFVSEAVATFLWQDYPNKELIVLNDCPGQEFVGDIPGVRFINCDKRFATLGEKRNACNELANGSLIAVWDDDDIYLPWRLSFTIAEMRRLKTCFYRAAEFWAYWGVAALHNNQSIPSWVSHPNTLYTKAVWQKVGGYPARDVREDGDFFAKIHGLLNREFIKYPLDRTDRFFVLRGTSNYAHLCMPGGIKPLDLSPGRRTVVPSPIADPILRTACEKLIAAHDDRLAQQRADGGDSSRKAARLLAPKQVLEVSQPNEECPNPQLWDCYDYMATEVEVLEFLYALIVMAKPEVVVETGTYLGFGTMHMADGLVKNGRGHLWTAEPNLELHGRAKSLFGAAEVCRQQERTTFVATTGLAMLQARPWGADKQIDIAFLDSNLETRHGECVEVLKQLSRHGIIAVHDTGQQHDGGKCGPRSKMHELAIEHQLQELHFATPRGLVLMRRRPSL